MSSDQRLRSGLSANTDHLQPDVDGELAALLGRAGRRRRVRTGGFALAAAATAAAVAIWLPGLADSIRANDDSAPVDRLDKTNPLPPSLEKACCERLKPGRYTARFFVGKAAKVPSGLADLRAVVEVPAGFSGSFGGVAPWPRAQGQAMPPSVRFSSVTEVASQHCTEIEFQDPGPTVEDLATALAPQPTFRSTDPVPTSVGGYDGLYLEVSWRGGDRECANGVGTLMFGSSGEIGFETPSTHRFWILDVGGERVVIELSHRPGATQKDIAALTRIVESTTFTTIEGSDR